MLVTFQIKVVENAPTAHFALSKLISSVGVGVAHTNFFGAGVGVGFQFQKVRLR